jgi:hypothetical protein
VDTREKNLMLALELADMARELMSEGDYQAATAHASVSQAYAAVAGAWGDFEPPVVAKPREPLPEWCGMCEGPEPGNRVVEAPIRPGEDRPRLMWCPRCEPRSKKYRPEQPVGAPEGTGS